MNTNYSMHPFFPNLAFRFTSQLLFLTAFIWKPHENKLSHEPFSFLISLSVHIATTLLTCSIEKTTWTHFVHEPFLSESVLQFTSQLLVLTAFIWKQYEHMFCFMSPFFPNLSFTSHRNYFLLTAFMWTPHEHTCSWTLSSRICPSIHIATTFQLPLAFENNMNTNYSMNPFFPNLSFNSHRNSFFMHRFHLKPIWKQFVCNGPFFPNRSCNSHRHYLFTYFIWKPYANTCSWNLSSRIFLSIHIATTFVCTGFIWKTIWKQFCLPWTLLS